VTSGSTDVACRIFAGRPRLRFAELNSGECDEPLMQQIECLICPLLDHFEGVFLPCKALDMTSMQ
jgi:hypothetical protein